MERQRCREREGGGRRRGRGRETLRDTGRVAQESPAEDHQAGHWPGGRLHQVGSSSPPPALRIQISCMLSDTPGGAHAPSEPANTSDLISTVGPCSTSEAERKWQGIRATEACSQPGRHKSQLQRQSRHTAHLIGHTVAAVHIFSKSDSREN
ncbi:hypothetical protein PAMP_020240 [Pampus punctatissimus]